MFYGSSSPSVLYVESNNQWLDLLAFVFPFVVSAVALFISIRTYVYSRKKGKLSSAIILSKEYMDILDKISLISSLVTWNPKIDELIKRVTISDDARFMKSELLNFYTKSEIDMLDDFFSFNSVDIKQLVRLYQTHPDNINPRIESIARVDGEPVPEKMLAYSELQLRDYFSQMFHRMMNELEYFSMNFKCGIAESSIVYQSLHQSFFLIVQIVYSYISNSNEDISEKFYTNIVDLYLMWKKEQISRDERIRKIQRKQNRYEKRLGGLKKNENHVIHGAGKI